MTEGIKIDIRGPGPVDIDGLELPHGETTVVFGPNGAGKTTMLRRIAGIRGKGLIPNVSYLQQRPYMFRGSAAENLGLGLSSEESAWAVQLAERLGVGDVLDSDAGLLSGGEIQRLALARALAVSAEWVLLDEPMGAIDLADRSSVMSELASALRGRSAVLVTHDIDVVATLANRLAIVDKGTLIEQGEVSNVIGSPSGVRTAEILGVANLIEGVAHSVDGTTTLRHGDVEIIGTGDAEGPARALFGAETLTLRSTDSIPVSSARNSWIGRVDTILHRGHSVEVAIDVGVRLVAAVTPGALAELDIHPGSEIGVSLKASAVRIVGA